jgi:hypothetical protein
MDDLSDTSGSSTREQNFGVAYGWCKCLAVLGKPNPICIVQCMGSTKMVDQFFRIVEIIFVWGHWGVKRVRLVRMSRDSFHFLTSFEKVLCDIHPDTSKSSCDDVQRVVDAVNPNYWWDSFSITASPLYMFKPAQWSYPSSEWTSVSKQKKYLCLVNEFFKKLIPAWLRTV